MKLSDHIELHNLSKVEFAQKIGVTVVSLDRYLAGTRRPEWPVLSRIRAVTNGDVTPNDFLQPDEDQAA